MLPVLTNMYCDYNVLLMGEMSNAVYNQQYISHLQMEEAKHRKLSVAADPEGLR